MTLCLTCLDAVWLLSCGVTVDEAARRLHLTRDSLVTHARRHGTDLTRWLAAEREQRNAELMEAGR